MPNLNPYMGASGVVVNLEGLRRDIRGNAFEYLARVYDRQSVESIASVINGNGKGYLIRIKDRYQAERADPVLAERMAQGLEVDASVAKISTEKAMATVSDVDTVSNDLDITDLLSKYDGLAEQCLQVAELEMNSVITSYDDVIAIAKSTLSIVPLVY